MKLSEMIKLGLNGLKPADIKEINEAGISTDDVIILTKNGYSIADMKELITLAGTEEEVQPGNEVPTIQQGPAEPKENEGAKGNDDKLKAQESEIEKLKTALRQMQEQNTTRNLGTVQEDPDQKLKEIFKGIY